MRVRRAVFFASVCVDVVRRKVLRGRVHAFSSAVPTYAQVIHAVKIPPTAYANFRVNSAGRGRQGFDVGTMSIQNVDFREPRVGQSRHHLRHEPRLEINVPKDSSRKTYAERCWHIGQLRRHNRVGSFGRLLRDFARVDRNSANQTMLFNGAGWQDDTLPSGKICFDYKPEHFFKLHGFGYPAN